MEVEHCRFERFIEEIAQAPQCELRRRDELLVPELEIATCKLRVSPQVPCDLHAFHPLRRAPSRLLHRISCSGLAAIALQTRRDDIPAVAHDVHEPAVWEQVAKRGEHPQVPWRFLGGSRLAAGGLCIHHDQRDGVAAFFA